ncbi:MAG: tRNA (guanosine(37)-N1)-methyltransferase TrmD [Limnochordia bacterium]
MKVDVVTLFPAMFGGPLTESMLGRALRAGLLDVRLWNPRGFARDKHRTVDDKPYGGGTGMVMRIEPLALCLDSILADSHGEKPCILVTSPQGRVLDDTWVRELAASDHLVVICGHYEGIDERLHVLYDTIEYSIGDYVLTGGELPAMVLIDAVSRFIPGVLGDPDSALQDCFSDGLLKYPQYTRPEAFRGASVPEVLLSGHHERIRLWRRKESLRRTLHRRADLVIETHLCDDDQSLLDEVREDMKN